MPSTETDRLIAQMLLALQEAQRAFGQFYPEKHKTMLQIAEAIRTAGIYEAHVRLA